MAAPNTKYPLEPVFNFKDFSYNEDRREFVAEISTLSGMYNINLPDTCSRFEVVMFDGFYIEGKRETKFFDFFETVRNPVDREIMFWEFYNNESDITVKIFND